MFSGMVGAAALYRVWQLVETGYSRTGDAHARGVVGATGTEVRVAETRARGSVRQEPAPKGIVPGKVDLQKRTGGPERAPRLTRRCAWRGRDSADGG